MAPLKPSRLHMAGAECTCILHWVLKRPSPLLQCCASWFVAHRIPQMAGKELDLHLLYREVTSKGGLTQVG